ncbi:hypothetical protein QBC40DRAFT_135852, partial [Triangularia verruculosa]
MSAISSHIRNIEFHRIPGHFATDFYGKGTSQFLRQCRPSRATPRPSTTPTTTTMEINALVNHHNDIHTSPSAERFYRLTIDRAQRPEQPYSDRNPRSKELTRDEKLVIRTIRQVTNWDHIAIARYVKKSPRQVQYALESQPTPQAHRRGRRPTTFTDDEKQALNRLFYDDPIARKL